MDDFVFAEFSAMSALSINSIIANLTSGGLAPFGSRPTPDQASTRDPGVVFTQGEPWRNQANGSAQVGYRRQDARGGLRGSEAPVAGDKAPSAQTTEKGEAPGQGEGGAADASKAEAAPQPGKKPSGEMLSKAEQSLLRELQKADQAVKAHELAHLSAAGGYARGGATFTYQRGPDGQNYAVGGEVQIDTSREKTPEATILKMQIIRQAALAPADPSPQDQQVAAHATLQIAEASKELLQSRAATSSQPATPQAAGEDEGEGTASGEATARGGYQEAGAGVAGQTPVTPASNAGAAKGYAAYRTPFTQPANSDRQIGLDRIA